MRVSVFAIGASIAAGAAAASSAKAPACVDKCWEYTKYVTNCGEDTQCLCDDAEYQNAVYQCLYSQCATAYFANALHHTLAICSAGPKTDAEAPALIRQDGLKAKRDAYTDCSGSASVSAPAGSGSVTRGSASVTRSAGGSRGSPSVSASNYLTSTGGRASPTGGVSGTPAPPAFTGAAATAGTGYGMLAVAGGLALAALA